MKTFIYNQRVYFSDTDAQGIVYHAAYLNFAEHARTELGRELHASGLSGGNAFFAHNSKCSARSALQLLKFISNSLLTQI